MSLLLFPVFMDEMHGFSSYFGTSLNFKSITVLCLAWKDSILLLFTMAVSRRGNGCFRIRWEGALVACRAPVRAWRSHERLAKPVRVRPMALAPAGTLFYCVAFLWYYFVCICCVISFSPKRSLL